MVQRCWGVVGGEYMYITFVKEQDEYGYYLFNNSGGAVVTFVIQLMAGDDVVQCLCRLWTCAQ